MRCDFGIVQRSAELRPHRHTSLVNTLEKLRRIPPRPVARRVQVDPCYEPAPRLVIEHGVVVAFAEKLHERARIRVIGTGDQLAHVVLDPHASDVRKKRIVCGGVLQPSARSCRGDPLLRVAARGMVLRKAGLGRAGRGGPAGGRA